MMNLPPATRAKLVAEARRRGLRVPGVAPSVHKKIVESLWIPQDGPQEVAFSSPATIIGYGGAAGGGKTDLACGLSLRKHTKSIIFRRDLTQVKDIETRLKEITEGKRLAYNHTDHLLTMPFGQTVLLAGLKDPNDWTKWKGRPSDLKVFDEATEFLELQVRSLLGWLRTSIANQKTQALLTFNPPTDENGEWVIRFFAPWLDPEHPNPAEPGEIRWFAMLPDSHGDFAEREVPTNDPITLPDGDVVKPISRTFIRARVSDNSYYAGGEYEDMLRALPEPLRSQLLKGGFQAGKEVNPWQIIPTAWVHAAQKRWREGKRPDIAQTAVGVDVAHGGIDNTVIAPRYGNWIDALKKYPGHETPDGKSAAALVMKEFEPGAYANVDAIGYGAPCAEKLIDSPDDGGYGIKAYPINVATSDSGLKKRYTDKSGKYFMRNLRAEMYWRLREALDPEGGDDLALPDDRQLLSDLCAPTYKITPSGILIEDKEAIKARIGRSTNDGDAVALSMLPDSKPKSWGQDPEALAKLRAAFGIKS